MFLSFYLVCIYAATTCCLKGCLGQEETTDLLSSPQLKNYGLTIAHQNTKIVKLEKHISRLETKIEQQNTRFADQSAQIEHQNTRFADQNTAIANQKILISEQNTKLCEIKSQLELSQKSDSTSTATQSPNIGNDAGVIFTRWGRTDCPQSISTKVYNGTTGGAHFTQPGGAANYVCLPGDPIFNQNKLYSAGAFGYMYGAEYENVPDSDIENYEVPCVVCRATPYSTKMMIPGRNKCYPGWKEAYKGDLNSGHSAHVGASEFVCLDQNPTAIGSKIDNNGKLFYPVRSQQGSIPASYKHNVLLTCVVCLK